MSREILECARDLDMPVAVCVVPRAKARKSLLPEEQKFFLEVQDAIEPIKNWVIDGTDYIVREEDTVKTHLARSGYGGHGDMLYPGIAKDTCFFSDDIKGKSIILIDDIYTKTINVIEDVAQALLDKGAINVVVLAIGVTVRKYC